MPIIMAIAAIITIKVEVKFRERSSCPERLDLFTSFPLISSGSSD